MYITITAGDFEVFKLIKKGLSNQEIADTLHIKKKTVQNRLARIYKKCEVNNRNKLAFMEEDDFIIGRKYTPPVVDHLPTIKRYISQGLTPTQMTRRLNVSRTTVYNYIKKAEQENEV